MKQFFKCPLCHGLCSQADFCRPRYHRSMSRTLGCCSAASPQSSTALSCSELLTISTALSSSPSALHWAAMSSSPSALPEDCSMLWDALFFTCFLTSSQLLLLPYLRIFCWTTSTRSTLTQSLTHSPVRWAPCWRKRRKIFCSSLCTSDTSQCHTSPGLRWD